MQSQPPAQDLKRKAAKGSLWSLVQALSGEGLSFITFLILARLLVPADIGLVALAAVFIQFLAVFINQGFVQSIVQRHDLQPGHLDSAFWANLGFSLVLALASFLAADLIAAFYAQPQLAEIIRWLSLGFVFGALSSIQEAVVQRDIGFKKLAVRRIASGVLGGGVGIYMAFAGYGVWSLVAKQLVEQAAGAVVLWWASSWRPQRRFSAVHFRELFGFEIHALGLRMLNFLNFRIDAALIGYFLGPALLGYYTVAQRLLQVVIHLLIVPSNQVALPIFSRLQNDPERIREAFYKATNLTGWLGFPVFLGVAVLAPEAISTFFGEKWLPSADVLQILVFVGLLQIILQFDTPILMAMGKSGWSLALRSVGAVLNVLAILFAVQWGIVAVAWAFVLRAYLMAPASVYLLQRLVDIRVSLLVRQFSKPLIASLAMAGMLFAARQALDGQVPGWLMLVAGGTLGFLMVAVFMRFLAREQFMRGYEMVQLAVRGPAS